MKPNHYGRGNQVEFLLGGKHYPQPEAERKEFLPENPGIGHNNPPSAADDTDDSVRFLYVQLHIGDYITGTMGMTPELEGAYCRFLLRLYQRGRAFPDNDRTMCAAMGLTIRVWKRLKDALVALGKIALKNGCLTNDRFEKERIKRAEMLRKQAESAHRRHARERAEKAGLPEVSPKFAESLTQTSGKLYENIDEKLNETNEAAVTDPGCPRILESYNQKEEGRKKEQSPPDSGAEAPLDETAQDIVWGRGLDWLRANSFTGSEAKLRTRVGRWVKEYGAEAVLSAMRVAQKTKPGEPMSYIEKILVADDRANQHVRWDGSRLQVMNGFEAELSTILGDGRDLTRALARAAGKITIGLSGVALETRVRAEIVALADQVADQDRRYAKAAAEKGGARGKPAEVVREDEDYIRGRARNLGITVEAYREAMAKAKETMA